MKKLFYIFLLLSSTLICQTYRVPITALIPSYTQTQLNTYSATIPSSESNGQVWNSTTGTIQVWSGGVFTDLPTTSTCTTGIGYASGLGGTVTQATSKATGVTLNKLCGTIITHSVSLAAATIVTFIVTNATIAANDVIFIQHDLTGTIGAYTVVANTPAAGSFKVTIRNNTAGALAEAIQLRYAIIKASVN